jgi:hypothetical protein
MHSDKLTYALTPTKSHIIYIEYYTRMVSKLKNHIFGTRARWVITMGACAHAYYKPRIELKL